MGSAFTKDHTSTSAHLVLKGHNIVCRHLGRKTTMLIAGVLFDIGVVFITAAWSLWVLIVGRVLLGIAVAFASVAVTLYNSEMAPAHIRGRLNQIFQVLTQAVLHGS